MASNVNVTYQDMRDAASKLRAGQHDIQGKPRNLDTVVYTDPPLWRRWYVAGPTIAVLAIAAGVIFANHLPGADSHCTVGDGMCK